MHDPDAPLSIQVEAAALRALMSEWGTVNHDHFRGQLRAPTLTLSDSRAYMARWMRATRTLDFARATLLEQPWGVVVEVLRHECAHQYVDEVMGAHDESAHGPAFRQVCERHGFDARAAGVPDASGAGGEEAVILDRIRKLLALAESPNEHEAQAAMNAAQRLMLRYNLDAVARRDAKGYTWRHLGAPSGRVDESQRYLGVILADFFFVECLWVSVWRVREALAGSVLEVCGSPENVDMAEYVHSFLHHTAEGLWAQHKRARGIQGDRDRRAYRAGVMAGFYEKLKDERRRNQEKGLVWAGDPALDRYFRTRWPRTTTIRRAGSGSAEARAHGREAGRNIVLRKGVSSSGGGGGGQLGPGGGG